MMDADPVQAFHRAAEQGDLTSVQASLSDGEQVLFDTF